MPSSPFSAVKTISKKSHPIMSSSQDAAVKKPRFKDLSYSFRGKCMAAVGAVFAAILKNEDASPSLCHYSAKLASPGVDGILVFRMYEGKVVRFILAVDAALSVIGEVDEDALVINETLNFTAVYDGTRTDDGEQRDTLMDHIDERLADIPFTDATL